MMKWSNISIIGTPEETTERMEQKHHLKKQLPQLHNKCITKSQIHEAPSGTQAEKTGNQEHNI